MKAIDDINGWVSKINSWVSDYQGLILLGVLVIGIVLLVTTIT